jgi:hypothetical protein
VILRSLLLSECELSLKVLVLVINVALVYTAVPLLRRRKRKRRRRKRRRYGHGGGGSGCSILALRKSRPVNRSSASLSFRALRVIRAQWAWWWWYPLRSFLIIHAASRVLVIKLSFHCF